MEGRLDTGVAKGSLSKELAIVGRVAVVSAVLGRGGMLSSDDVKDFIDQFATSIQTKFTAARQQGSHLRYSSG
jgi:hypothetical protein